MSAPGPADQDRLRREERAQRAKPVRAQRVAGGDEVDDPVGEPEPRRDLDRAGHVDELDLDRQQLARQPGIDGRDRRAREILDRLVPRLLGHGGLEPARPVPELEQLLHARSPLANEILPGDPAVDDAVLHVLGDVGGAHEQDVDRRVPARERERPLAGLLRAEPGVLEQRDRRLPQPPLDRDGDRQAVDVVSFRRSSAKR